MFSRKKTFVLLTITLSILLFGIFFHKLLIDVNHIIDRDKCPACFGTSLCKDIDNNKITLEYSDFYSVFNNLFSIKNVFYGKYKNENVIIKKLAQKSELQKFDELVCSVDELFELCPNETKVIKKKTNFYELIVSELSNSDMTDPNVKIRLCPTVAKVNELLSNALKENTVKNEDYYKFLYSLIKINPEPIILQILSSSDKWPTPKYFGSCGRIVVEEHSGLPLSSFIDEPWIKRAAIASSLLEAAHMFTYKHPKFAFYLADISMDNIVTNAQNKVTFIDIENIIIVDKYPSPEELEQKPEWNKTYIAEVFSDCESCFIFSPTDICSHKISDHNYYAICQHIFTQGLGNILHSKGLLHDVPTTILEQHPHLPHLIKQCSKLEIETHYSRIDYGVRLKTALDRILKNVK